VRIRLQILHLMRENGTEVGALCTTEKGELPARVALSECFKAWDLEGSTTLQQLLAA
jgi:hypothetical protein